MTQGRPGISTRTMVYELVEQFQNLRLGTASAIAYILLIILAVMSYIQIRLGEGD